MRLISHFTILFCLAGCGLESTPGPVQADENPPPGNTVVSERAVGISSVNYSPEGVEVTCRLHRALVAVKKELSLFIEFEGTVIETATVFQQEEYRFQAFIPPQNGNLVCVVELAQAEFESEAVTIIQDGAEVSPAPLD